MGRFLLLVIASLYFSLSAISQILNVESQRILQDSSGWVGKGNLSFNITSNQKQVIDLNSSLHIQYKRNKNTFMLLGGAAMIRADKNDFHNDGHIHFRYNHDLNQWLTLEAFVQGQYNRVLMIDHRELVGTGPRFQLVRTEGKQLYFATLYMFEHEVILNENLSSFHHRLSSYVALNWKVNDQVSMRNIMYFQPRIDEFDDHRIMLQSGLKFKISKMLGFTIDFNLLNDSNPPTGIRNTVYSLRNGLEINL